LVFLKNKPVLALIHIYTHTDECAGLKPQGCPIPPVILDLNETLKYLHQVHPNVKTLLAFHIPSKDVTDLVKDVELEI